VTIAQTNLQLYRQLEVGGWSMSDRQRAMAAYALIAELHAGQYRASGKTFVAHLCGTASIVDGAGGSVEETLAALLHAVYDAGDFGDGRRGAAPHKRAEVRASVGTAAETMVAAYFDWPWRARLADVLDGGAGVLEDWERPVAFLRLANEVEERVDGADGYAPGHAAFVFPLDDVARCARHLGRNELVTFAEERTDVLAAPVVPDPLQMTTVASGPITPRSLTTRRSIRGTGEQSLVRHAARRVPGARRVVYVWRQWRSPAS
jgi:hypothetical protein